MKILLTGGTGYIGSHVAVELIQAGHEVEVVDNLWNSTEEVLDRVSEIAGVRPKFHEVDLLESEKLLAVFREGKFDAVMHFAGLKSVAESVEKPLFYYENNVGGTINLLKCMREIGANRMVFSSSATVYGEVAGGKCVENLPVGRNLANPYGRTKYMIEEILRDEAAAWPDFEVTILRYFNPVGNHPSGLLGENPKGKPNNLMPVVMKVARGEMPELLIYGDDYETPDGTCRRDYIHVVDLAQGHVAALDAMRPGVSVYNLGTGKPTSVMEMMRAFEKASGRELPYRVVGRRAGDLPVLYADSGLAFRELGWKAKFDIDDAMQDTLKYLHF